MKRIALIEEDTDLGLRVRVGLEREGYAVSRFGSAHEGLAAVRSGGFDFVIVDGELADPDGAAVCRMLRRDGRTKSLPIVMLAARAAEREPDADDTILKPINMRELVAHVGAVWRQTRRAAEEPDVYEDEAIRVDSRTFRVTLDGADVKLARKEFELLWLLVRNAAQIVPRERIRAEVWHIAGDVETRTIDAHIRNLRRKLGAARIKTVVGAGYRYEGKPET